MPEHKCSVCGETFGGPGALGSHKRVHDNDGENSDETDTPGGLPDDDVPDAEQIDVDTGDGDDGTGVNDGRDLDRSGDDDGSDELEIDDDGDDSREYDCAECGESLEYLETPCPGCGKKPAWSHVE